MDVEDTFGISISDDAAQEILTVGQLHDEVLRLLQISDAKKWLVRPNAEQEIWKKLRELSADLASGVKASQITRETRFIQDLGYD